MEIKRNTKLALTYQKRGSCGDNVELLQKKSVFIGFFPNSLKHERCHFKDPLYLLSVYH